MSYIVQNVLDKARIPLNDADKARASDTTLLSFFNDAVLLLRNKRPDIFMGQFLSLPENLAVGEVFPLPSEFVPPVADYITARVESGNDEAVLTERATMFFNLFKGGL
ncbi:MAG: hypothetical protein A2143_00760 [Gallionellales bacterium RBG_16_57_15]|nr:MAG: hypothetical protein A2143_00760 [Gallionellales bacterium RBG_16_57_15]